MILQSRANDIKLDSLEHLTWLMSEKETELVNVINNLDCDDEDRYRVEKELGKIYNQIMKKK